MLRIPGIETPPDQRVRTIEVSNELVLALLRLDAVQPGRTYSHDIPDDLVILGAILGRAGSVSFLAWSATFEPVCAGYVIPSWDPTYTVHTEPVEAVA